MKIFMMLLCIAFAKAAIAQNPPPSQEVLEAFTARTFEHNSKELPYRIVMPSNFDPNKKYPLHLFLHGAGERGNDNQSQLIHGSSLFLEKREEYPAIVIFPQCPAEDYWAAVAISRGDNQNIFEFPESPKPTWAMEAVLALLDTQLQNKYVDKNRIYLSGLSMGGMGTFELLYHRPTTFAAATPICGGGYPDNVKLWAQHTPAWIFHGDDDNVVPTFYSKTMVEALLKYEVTPKATFYPNVGHDSWTNAFAEKELFPWIYSHVKNDNVMDSKQLNEGDSVKEEENEDDTPEWLKFSEEALIGRYQGQNEALVLEKDPNRIVFMGDSITEGWTETSALFWEEHPNFVNRGVSGQTTSQMLVRFRQDVIALNPKTVIILAGTNDIAGNTGKTAIKTIANNIYTMADLAKYHGINVILSSVLPVYDYPWKTGLQPAEKIIALNTMLQEYALQEGHTFLDYHIAMKNTQNGMIETLSYDGVHCTKAGYEQMEMLLVGVLNKR